MAPVHRNTDKRYCAASDVVTLQMTHFVNNLLSSVENDPNDHCSTGFLQSVSPGTFFVNNIKTICAQMDLAKPDIPGCLGAHPTSPVDPQQGSQNYFIYAGMGGGGMGSLGGMLGGMFGQAMPLNMGELVSIGNFGQIAQFGNIANAISNFGGISNFGSLGSVIGNFSGFGDISGIMGAINSAQSMIGADPLPPEPVMIGTVKNNYWFDNNSNYGGKLSLQNVRGGTPKDGMTAIGHDTGNIFTFSKYNTGLQWDNHEEPDWSLINNDGIVCDETHIALDTHFTGLYSQDYQPNVVVVNTAQEHESIMTI